MNWIYLLLILTGFFPLLVVLYRKNQLKRWRETGIATKATVVKIPIGRYSRMTSITIQYHVKETGQLIEKQITVAGNPYTVGQQLALLYKKENPHKLILDPEKSFTGMIVFAVIIAIAIIAATFMIRKSVAEGLM